LQQPQACPVNCKANRNEKQLKNIHMETKETRLNFAFRFYDESGRLIDKLDGPGHIGYWLGGPDSPFYAAIMPVSFEKVISRRNLELVTKTVRLPLDEKGNPLESESEVIAMYEAEDIEDAKELAKDLGCEYIYWIEWDCSRFISVIYQDDPDSEYTEFYYAEDF
jgi:hypothetical protein